MKLLKIPCIILVTLSRGAGVAFAADTIDAAGFDDNGRVQPKRDITLSMSTSQTEFAADEAVVVDFTLTNNEAIKPARILNWINPCISESPMDMSFFDVRTVGGQPALYLGALIKRKAPTKKDYKTLKAGEQISCTINLGEYFQFTAPSDDDIYEINYAVISTQISNPSSVQGTNAMESLETDTSLTVKVNARAPPPSRALRDQNLRGLQTGGNTFNSCSSSQQTLIRDARTKALAAATDVVSLLSNVSTWGTTARCTRYSEWFGPYSSSRATQHAELKKGFEEIRTKLNSSSITFDCSCTRPIFAYIYPSDTSNYRVYLCSAFWNTRTTGIDSRMGTLIHEMSHFTNTAQTLDYAYGQTECRKLATSSPSKTINNADSHEYIAENSPARSCNR